MPKHFYFPLSQFLIRWNSNFWTNIEEILFIIITNICYQGILYGASTI